MNTKHFKIMYIAMYYCRQWSGGHDESVRLKQKWNSHNVNQHRDWNLERGAPPKRLWLTHFRESFQNFVRRWMDGFHYFPDNPLPHPLFAVPFLSIWKGAWCPLESPSQATETLLSPGNLGPSESPPPPKNRLRMNRQLCTHIIPKRIKWKLWDADEI